MNKPDALDAVKRAVLSVDTLIGFTASGRQRNHQPQWEKVTVRPVEIGGVLHYQVSSFDGRQDATRNHRVEEFGGVFANILGEGFANLHVQSLGGDVHARITKRGKVLISRGRPSAEQAERILEHNRTKQHLLTPDNAPDVLKAVGILSEDGQIKPTMQRKFRQVNAFLKLLEGKLSALANETIRIVDCGCGSAFLTLCTYALLAHVRERDVRVVGIDRNEGLIDKCRRLSKGLGWDHVTFEACSIADYTPDQSPHVVFSLHACDTATDEAIAQAVHWNADLIVAAPCCQQELSAQVTSDVHQPVLTHGILKQRTADILTDAIRAQLLRIVGYDAEVVEFISSEDTSKNLMIRAEKGQASQKEPLVLAYKDLKRFWQVDPALEHLLGSQVAEHLAKVHPPQS